MLNGLLSYLQRMKISYNAPVILSFALLSTAIFFISQATGGHLMRAFTLIHLNPSEPTDYFQLVSHILGHVNLSHLMGNMTFILLLGPIVEEKYGSRKTLFMILITALITGVLNLIFFDTGLIGASGIVFMLILLVSFTNVKSGEIPLSFILVALLFIGKEVIQSMQADQVSQYAHIMGGICGSIFGLVSR